MSDLYRIPEQHTFRGRTAGSYLRTALAVRNKAGFGFVVTDDLHGYEMLLTEDGALVLNNYDGDPVCLSCSKRALTALRRLTAAADRL